MKKCSKCQELKEISFFNKGRTECKDCSKKNRELNKEKIKIQKQEYYLKNKEYILNRCKQYELKNKQKAKEKSKKYNIENKEKIKEYHRTNYIENKEYIQKRGKEYYKRNKAKILQRNKKNWIKNHKKWKKTTYKPDKQREYTIKYINKNKDEIAKRRRDRRKYLHYNDVNYRLKSKMRSSIYRNIKKGGGTKDSRTETYLGCSFEDFKKYIESKFIDGMNWENCGGKRYFNNIKNKIWELDHIKPLVLFDLSNEDERKIAFHYTNFEPKWWWINALKNDLFHGISVKTIPKTIIKHESLIKTINELFEI